MLLQIREILTKGFWEETDKLRSDFLINLMEEAKSLALKSKSNNTVKKYASYFSRWKAWASQHLEGNFLPGSGIGVGLYLTYVGKVSKSHSALNAHLYSIKWAHDLCGLPDPTSHPFPKIVMEAVKRQIGKKVTQKTPIDAEILKKLCARYGGGAASLKDLRFLSMALLAYAGFLRFSELRSIRLKDVKFEKDFFYLKIDSSKTDVYKKGAELVIASVDTNACPMYLLIRYLKMTKLLNSGSNCFIFRTLINTKEGFILNPKDIPISYSKAREDLRFYMKEFIEDHGNYGWHSFRHGGATAAANAGVPDRLFKIHGRWASEVAKDNYVHEDLSARLSVSKALNL